MISRDDAVIAPPLQSYTAKSSHTFLAWCWPEVPAREVFRVRSTLEHIREIPNRLVDSAQYPSGWPEKHIEECQ